MQDSFTKRALISAAVFIGTVAVISIVYFGARVLMLVFAGMLVAVFLRGLARWVAKHTPLTEGWGVLAVIVGLLALVGLFMWLLIPNVVDQFQELGEMLPQSIEHIRETLQQYPLGEHLVNAMPKPDKLLSELGAVMQRMLGFFSSTLGLLVSAYVILFLGLYLAAQPGLYIKAIIALFPKSRHDRVRNVLHVLGYTMEHWLIGRFFSMAIIGVLTWVGLKLLGIPLALSLSLFSAFMSFIPNIGPIIAVLPAALLALPNGFSMAFYVLLLYYGIQTLESYLLTPVIQQHQVRLPPALVLSVQLLLSIFLGILGLLLATPLTACAMVLVQMLYVRGYLGEDVNIKGGNA